MSSCWMRNFTLAAVVIGAILYVPQGVMAARISDVANTPHNLSSTGPGTARADSETQICVFCHTPHKAEDIPAAPLWNRKLSGATYTPYTSESMDAVGLGQPGGSSKLCLSCHDGTLALGAVNVLNGQENVSIDMRGTGPGGIMPAGSGEQTGFTRYLGTDLTNDHPVSFLYNSTLASNDGELRDPASNPHIANRASGVKPLIPLEDDQLQCVSCHDPHIRDENVSLNIKFLRLNRFQKQAPGGGVFNPTGDIVCLGCHDKLGQAWAGSAHASQATAFEQYTAAAASLRDFPAGIRVWEAACLNCHDTHTVQGSRRLLREGTDSMSTPKSGGNSAIEESCYQCHSSTGDVLLGQGGGSFEVPDIKSDFTSLRRMPITGGDQPAGSEVHEITDGDFSESQLKLGRGNLNNRHVECTDCHNPHRVTKAQQFNDAETPSGVGTHPHTSGHTNIASGVLRGTWGVEPVYGSSQFGTNPSSYIVKRGDGGVGASTNVGSSHVTREYQVCLKCHSDYAYNTPPNLGDSGGGTPAGTNEMNQYTNQAMEFQAPGGDRGEPGGNHRSWHPVIDDTGRTPSVRGGLNRSVFLTPWNGSADIGTQTMYCSDCHGSSTANGTSTPSGGDNGNPWGPHGSVKDFILKGDWDSETGTGQQDDLCFKCHDYNNYANPNNSSPLQSGFSGGGGMGGGGMGGGGMCGLSFAGTNLHIGHAGRIGRLECSWCHTMVPHGWKNKALLVDISQEGGNEPYTNGPYYQEAMLGGGGPVNWQSSGNWTANDCGGAAWMGGGGMGGGGSCSNPP